MRTQSEIDRQITGLQKMKESLPEFSAFGDQNWKAIEAQISIIKGRETLEDYANSDYYIEGEAYAAQEWFDGNSDADLFEE